MSFEYLKPDESLTVYEGFKIAQVESSWYIYDSLNKISYEGQLSIFFKKMYPLKNSMTVNFVNVFRQHGGHDCGLF